MNEMVKDPDEIFDIDAIAAKNLTEAQLRLKAFELAVIMVREWQEHRPAKDISALANKIIKWCHTGDWPG